MIMRFLLASRFNNLSNPHIHELNRSPNRNRLMNQVYVIVTRHTTTPNRTMQSNRRNLQNHNALVRSDNRHRSLTHESQFRSFYRHPVITVNIINLPKMIKIRNQSQHGNFSLPNPRISRRSNTTINLSFFSPLVSNLLNRPLRVQISNRLRKNTLRKFTFTLKANKSLTTASPAFRSLLPILTTRLNIGTMLRPATNLAIFTRMASRINHRFPEKMMTLNNTLPRGPPRVRQ